MLTRLKVTGFKNLVDVDVAFGPFTCIAGVNGVGKSNLFDAITFLGGLAEKPLLEAALSVRSEGGRGADLRSIFHRVGDRYADEMAFEAEMLIPPTGTDDLGQEATAAITFLCYRLVLGWNEVGLTVRTETLTHINLGQAKAHLSFPHTRAWRESVVDGRRTSDFISTEAEKGVVYIKLHQDLGKDYKGGGRPRSHVAERLTRTVLSDAKAADSRTAALARTEMQSWRLLQLEPSGLRQSDSFMAPRSIAPNGAHMPATLARLTRAQLRIDPLRFRPSEIREPSALPTRVGAEIPLAMAVSTDREKAEDEAAAVTARVANRLAELIEGVRSVRVDADERRELLTLMLTERNGTEHEARSLSDGTLRFLALAILENDSAASGVLCMEEPENGIHPKRIPAMLRLLQDLAVNTNEPVGEDNPMRQVIVNTHSPLVAAQVPGDCLLVAIPQTMRRDGLRESVPAFRWLPDTWRAKWGAKEFPEIPTVSLGDLLSYLNPLERRDPKPRAGTAQRVIDRDDVQSWLPFEEGRRPS
ncbi:MAG TPA: AAA family ATPase [Thermoanaerobaculia bacterium]|nr:AAA family ATPase [Thermoanaerobaculia bacterium]